ncbi:MAG TPA: NAD-dependent malic enzyme [Candidatus Dormibacteraeota bacterium]|nr:NAD-dependent malic enzyme [Candidatus Dormibacteraeota bacterium]
MKPVSTKLRGQALLREPLLNKGTAFSLEERASLGLNGLLPPQVKTLEEQAVRAYEQYRRQPDDLAKNVYLTALHDRNEVLFYRLLTEHLPEMLPIVYTPTVALAIERYSHQYRRPRGVFLSIDHPELLEASFRNARLGPTDVDLIVATDGERILGIGDWGVGGIDISIGKLDVYTAASGIDPTRVIPVILDVGTDRQELLDDPQYLGNRHRRVRGEAYDAFIDRYVSTVARLFPDALLHWEDFGAENARRILMRYRDRHRTFNDDMQGTGAVVLAASLGAMRLLGQRLRDQRVVMFGAGTAGIGIADQLRDAMVRDGLPVAEAMRRFWCVGRHGLCTTDMASSLRDFQLPYARPAGEIGGWSREESGGFGLAEVVRQVKPTILIGTSTVGGAFTEAIVRGMAAQVERPIIFPLTNPTAQSEAVPADLLAWTKGRAVIATGSPFDPVSYAGKTYPIAQANNALVFPGLGLGTIVTRARTVSDGMLAAAAAAVAALTDSSAAETAILPAVENLRPLSAAVAGAVARAAIEEGLAQITRTALEEEIRRAMWQPVYRPVVAG